MSLLVHGDHDYSGDIVGDLAQGTTHTYVWRITQQPDRTLGTTYNLRGTTAVRIPSYRTSESPP